MKRNILCLLILSLLVMTGCGQANTKNTDSSVLTSEETEAQTFSASNIAAYSDKGFYVFDEGMEVLSFVDKASKKTAPLCSKPNCLHKDSTCDAYFGNAWGVYFSDNFLYVMTDGKNRGDVALYRMNADGSERTELGNLLYLEDVKNRSISIAFIVYRGYGYLAVNWAEQNMITEEETLLYRVSLDNCDKEEIFRVKGYEPSIRFLNTENGLVYLISSCADKDNTQGSIEEQYCYNTVDETMTKMTISNDKVIDACYDNRKYLMYRDIDPATFMVNKTEFFSSDSDGGNLKSVYSLENIPASSIFRDSLYRYITIEEGNVHSLLVLSYDGEEICKINKSSAVIWSDTENILFRDNNTCQYSLYNISSGEETKITNADS